MTQVQSSLWYCAFLTREQVGAGGVKILRERFAAAVREAGEPEGACLFATTDAAADSDADVVPDDGTPTILLADRDFARPSAAGHA